ncbi:MAG TPA: hypothetical protein PLL06_00875 [Acidobacteriota bacterium]|nr:hypothetical protein [Acidobacteriota bacterium]HMZ78220.1 hypothetical protein [Acidobacteriota bacterium]HNB71057.1 hypothetical protein [Acidobacteriota bacterium]HNC43185.1 hypothetical protein [Acidobacteriota bacterium]HND20144.1 hypothetical protein [Acidobacteriota bacterium]
MTLLAHCFLFSTGRQELRTCSLYFGLTLALMLTGTATTLAQERPAHEIATRISPQNTRPASRPTPPSTQPSEAASPANESPELAIAKELRALVKAVESMRDQQQAQVAVGFLQVQQARLGALETQIASARAQVAQLKRQQGQNQARSGNIRNELLGRTILDQAEGERIIRAEIQAEETRLQQEIFEAEQQLTLMQQEYDLKKLETDQIRDQIWNYLRATPTSNE